MSSLTRLFEPRGVAVIGASADPSRIGGQPVKFLATYGYAGRVYPVNPKHTEIAGLRCYPSVGAIDGPCDLALIALPADRVAEAVRACGAAGIDYAIIFSAGFRETGERGAGLEAGLTQAAAQSGVRLVGPNCQGMINVPSRLFAGFGAPFLERDLLAGDVSIVSQSGGFGFSVVLACEARGVGFRLAISTGNESDISTPELIDALVDDPGTRLICGYIEGVADGRALINAARHALRAGKPVLMWKSGNSEAGARAAASHTANMTGTYEIYRAAFRQAGIIEVDDIEDIADSARAFALARVPRGPRVAAIGISGGAGILFSDRIIRNGLRLATLAPETRESLRQVVPAFGSVTNPVDVTASVFNDPQLLTKTIDLVLGDPEVDQLAMLLASLPGEAAAATARAIVAALERHDKPVLVAWSARRHRAEDAFRILEEARIPIYESPVRLADAAAKLVAFRNAQIRAANAAPAEFVDPTLVIPDCTGELDEIVGKRLLAAVGIPVVEDVVVADAEAAVAASRDLRFPLAAKIVSPDILHKTDMGGVRLGLRNPAELAQAIRDIDERVRCAAPNARRRGFALSEMIPNGLETIAGIVQDTAFGPVVMLGLGGTLTEALRDMTYRIAPFDENEARSMIGELRGARLFDGFRDAPVRDVDALAGVLARLSRIAWTNRDRLMELEINPLFVLAKGAGVRAADALVIMRDEGTYSPLRE